METSNDPFKSAAKRELSPLREAAQQCKSLACWLALRRTWALWEQERAGDRNKTGSRIALPPQAEMFFQRYAHAAYCKWIPIVLHKTRNRKENERERRKADQEEFDKLITGEAQGEETKQTEKLAPETLNPETMALAEREELFGALADDLNLDLRAAKEKNDGRRERVASSQDIKLSFRSVRIPEPERPRDSDDKTRWQAWDDTVQMLWAPRTQSKRVLFNELFKQPMNKPSSTPKTMLRCLTGYLKWIIRDIVEIAVSKALNVTSDEATTSIDEPASRRSPDPSYTGGDVLASDADTVRSVSTNELREWADKVVRDEFFHGDNSDGVRLSYFFASLKKGKGKGKKYGFTVSIYDPALTGLIGARSTLGDHITNSRERLGGKANTYAFKHKLEAEPLIEWLEMCAQFVAAEWFWSENIDRALFDQVMSLIHLQDDPQFSCPRKAACATKRQSLAETELCWDCPHQ